MSTNSTPEKVTAEHVLWYIPNKIGYVRVITAALSFFVMKNHPTAFTWLYSTSCLLDALDGTMARKYNQVSSLGAVLDMVTDRSSTAGLMCFLCVQYPQWCVFFQLMLGLDITSHYMHMYASLSAGKTSHKSWARVSPDCYTCTTREETYCSLSVRLTNYFMLDCTCSCSQILQPLVNGLQS